MRREIKFLSSRSHSTEIFEASKGLCEAIASRKESIEEYENKIEGLKGACECTRCGMMVAKDMAFCPYCGSPVTEEDIFEADDLAQEAREEAEEAEERVTEAAEAAVEAVTEAAEEAVDAVEESVKEETEE